MSETVTFPPRDVLALTGEIHDAYPIRGIIGHESATITGSAPVLIVTSPEQWSYAASVPLHTRQLSPVDLAADPVVVLIRGTVESGRASFALMAADGATVVNEVQLEPSGGDEEVALLSGPLSVGSRVVVRNAADRGEASVVAMREIRVFRVTMPEIGTELQPPANLKLVPVPGWGHYYGSVMSGLREQVRAREYGLLRTPKPMQWLRGLRIMIYPGTEISRAMYISGLYEPNSLIVAAKLLPEGGAFVDVGANMGMFSLLAAAEVGATGRVFAFEPSSREYERLKANLALNRLGNVEAIPLALGDVAGTARLMIAPERHSGLNTTGRGFGYVGVSPTAFEYVATTTLDSWASERPVDRIDLIKLDVEGSELKALRGMEETLARFRPALILEVFAASLEASGATIADLEAFLRARRYSFWRIGDRCAHLERLGDLAAADSENVTALPVEREAGLLSSVQTYAEPS